MYPTPIRPDAESYAERRLYEAMSRDLPGDWLVFHSARWLMRDTRGGAQDGETDFIVVAPQRGILVLEVKGGLIRYDGPSGQWYSYDRPIKDPFAQASKSQYNLVAKLREMPVWQRGAPRVHRAVAFPDVCVTKDLRPDAPRAIVLDARALDALTDWFEGVFDYYDSHSPLGAEGLQALTDLLAPSRTLRLPLADAISRAEERIVALTEEQYRILDLLCMQRRFAVFGCAGTGKTMLAIEQARRLASQGFAVLLTCFNGPLVGYIQGIAALPPAVTVTNYHRLCRDVGVQAGLAVNEPANPDSAWYQERLPEILLEAAGRLGGCYDAIIVDEGQDFRANYWEPLLLLLRDPDRGPFYVFYDDSQILYEEVSLPEGLAHFPLTRNMRNTQCIHRAFACFYRPREGAEPVAEGPEGLPVEAHYYSTEHELLRHLGRVLHRLTRSERVLARDIVVLAPHGSRGIVHDLPRLANLQLVTADRPGAGEVQCTTIHKFKGQEKPVVILAGLEPEARQNVETLFYVGASRARHYLVVLAREDIPESLRAQLPPEADSPS